MAWIILDANGGSVSLKVHIETTCNWFFYYGVGGHTDADSAGYPDGEFTLPLGIASSNTGSEPISLFFVNLSGENEGYLVKLEWFQEATEDGAVVLKPRGTETLSSKGPVPINASPVPPNNGTCTVPAGVDYQLMPIHALAMASR